MLGRTLKMAFWLTYDHIGSLLVTHIPVLLALLPVTFASAAAGGVWASGELTATLLLVPAVPFWCVALVSSVGTAHMVKVCLERREGGMADWWAGVRQYAGSGVVLGLVTAAVAIVVPVAAAFYGRYAQRYGWWAEAGVLGAFVWLGLFLFLAALYAIPAVVQKRQGPWAALRIGGMLVLANPFYSLGLGVLVLLWVALCGVLMPLLVLLVGAGPVVLASSGYELLARRYAPENEGVTDFARDAEDDYLNRGFRDFLFPWKG